MNFDGFDIVADFFNKYPGVKENIERNSGNSYCSELIKAHRNRYPIWVVVEVLSFGDLWLLNKYMADMGYYGDPKKAVARDSISILHSVHDLRNAAAHNHCLLRNLSYSDDIHPESLISNYVAEISEIKKDQRRKTLCTRFQHDFTCLVYSIDNFILSESMKKDAADALTEFLNGRVIQNKDYFRSCIAVKNAYNYCKKIVDYYLLKY